MSGLVWERIEESRARHNVLEHPFYVRWSAGELTLEEIARYAGQYRHATQGLARLAANSDRVLAPLARERAKVAGFIRNANTAGEATAERSADLEAHARTVVAAAAATHVRAR